jgi:hypothetical protein
MVLSTLVLLGEPGKALTVSGRVSSEYATILTETFLNVNDAQGIDFHSRSGVKKGKGSRQVN